ncbi:hypothetical protein ACFL6I_20875, partial [candidate division KSB1 bacterium]
ESNSLNNIVRAGVYFMVRSDKAINKKQSIKELEELADRIIDTGGNPEIIEHINLKLELLNNHWIYKE